jgi:DNA repair protein RadC
MQKLVNSLKVHEITMHDHLASGRNTHLLAMVEFCYNVKKRKMIHNEIMVQHNHPLANCAKSTTLHRGSMENC